MPLAAIMNILSSVMKRSSPPGASPLCCCRKKNAAASTAARSLPVYLLTYGQPDLSFEFGPRTLSISAWKGPAEAVRTRPSA